MVENVPEQALERLNDVQTRDLELDRLEEERGKVPPELTSAAERWDRLEQSLALKEHEQSERQAELSRSELELGALEERRKAAAESALRADSSKEASQFQNQELQFSTRIQELEEDTMPLLEKLERIGQEVADLKAELSELEPELSRMRREEEERTSAIDEQLAAVRAERDELAQGIDPLLLRQYEQVRRARRGVGLVEIIANERCGGCSVRLPIHVIQKARRGVGVTRCPSCGRILWSKA